jgi:hypothetical protein
MKRNHHSQLGAALMLAAAVLPGRLNADTIQANADDARFRTNSSGTVVGGPEEVPNGGTYIGRKYYGNGENNHFVVPFALPDLGEGIFSEVAVSFRPTGQEGGPDVNLWAIPGSRAASTTLQSDVNNGSQNHTALGTLVKDTFWDGSTGTGAFVSTGAGEQATLGSWLNTAYANGDNAYNYVFVRLSSKSLWPSLVGDNAYFNIDTANSGNKPYLTYTFTPVDPRAPGVTDFSVSPTTMYGGATATLSWWVTGADTVTIDNGVGSVVGTGSGTVAPTVTTTYTLTATNTFGTRVRKTTITVVAPPTSPISLSNPSFETNRSTSGTGAFGSGDLQDLGLTSPTGWSVIATDNTQATNNGQEIAFGWISLTPAHPASGPPQPQALSLMAGAVIGQTTSTPWSSLAAGDVLSLRIAAGDRNINAPAGTPRWPDNSFFGLSDGLATRLGSPPATPSNDAGSATSWIGNQVAQTFVETPPGGYKSGIMGDVALTYTVQASDLTRSGNVGVFIASLGDRDGTGNGITSNARQSFWDHVRLGVVSLRPYIASFSASPTAIDPGDSTTLSWSVIEAASVTINPGNLTGPATGSVSVSPAANTTYTLSATNASGTSTATTEVIVLGPGPFRHYRFVPTKDRMGGTPPGQDGEDFQIAEFQMLLNGTWIPCPASGVTSPGASRAVTDGEGARKANDNRPIFVASGQAGNTSQGDSKWNDSGMPPLQYDFGVTTDVNGYRICTANDSEERDPVSWRVEGSHDGANWVLVDQKTDYATTTDRNRYLPDFTILPFAGPDITFTTSAPQIVAGGSATLNWNVTGADPGSISIDQSIGTVTASGSQSVSPVGTTTYNLTATGGGVTKSKSVTIQVVLGLPLNYNFDDATFQGWTDVGTVGWSVTSGHGDIHQGTNSVRSLFHDNSHPTTILRSPSFTLNGNGDLIAWLAGGAGNVATLAGTAVSSLPANSLQDAGFQGIALRNASTGMYALSARRPGNNGDGGNAYLQVSFSTAQLAALDQAATYTLDLVDSNHGGWAWISMDTVTIPGNLGGGSLPQIGSFTATPATIGLGGSSTLAWSVTGATSISIDQGVGSGLAESGSQSVSPTATTTTYTLTASNGSGTVNATATVTIAAPVISSFTATPLTVNPGGSSTLAWSVTGATNITIDNGVGSGLAASGSQSVTPAASTTYTLTATNPHGTTTATVTVGVVLPGPYRYYRFVPTALRNPGDNSVSIGEFQMVLNGNRIAGATASETPADSPGGEGPAEGNDNNLGTKWLNFSKTNARLILDFGTSTNVTAYRIGMSDDNGGRAPVSWRVEGSHDASIWAVLDVQTNYPTPESQVYLTDFPLGSSTPPFESWASDKGLTGPNAAFNADPDNDGTPNGIEFVTNGEPNPANAGAALRDGLPASAATSGNLVVTYTSADAAAYLDPYIEFATSLSGPWTRAQHGMNGVTIQTTDNGATDTVVVSIPMNGDPAKFARLKVVEP